MRHISQQHLVLATSKKMLTMNNVNEAFANAQLNHSFTEVVLEGNLRSSPAITELTSKFQGFMPSSTGNIPVKTSLEFRSPPPKVTLIDSQDRIKFTETVVEEVRKALCDSEDIDVMVLYFCHMSLALSFSEELTNEEKERVTFLQSMEALGCQFPIVIFAADFASIAPNCQYVTDILTRVTVDLRCIINTSNSPMMIKDQVAFKRVKIGLGKITSYLEELSSASEGTIIIADNDQIVPPEISSKLPEDVEMVKEWSEIVEKSQHAATFVDVREPGFYSRFCQDSHAPVIQLNLFANEDDVKKDDDDDDNYDLARKSIVKFFKKYSQLR